MYNIGICDDHDKLCHQVQKAVMEYCHGHNLPVKVDVFQSAEDVYDYFLDGKELDLLFLDIEMYAMNGIELGNAIRSEFGCESLQIVYISAKQKYAMDLFKVRPLNFLIKPLKKPEIIGMVKLAMSINASDDYFSYKIGRDWHRENQKDILYFESNVRQIIMVTTRGETVFYDRMKDVLDRVDNDIFFPIHKSLVINYRHIKDFFYDRVVMSNEATLPISQKHRKNVRDLQIKCEEELLK